MLKKLFGVILILAGLFVGIYWGFWLCFIGGIAGIIMGGMAGTLTFGIVAWNLIKVFIIASVWEFVGYMLGMAGGASYAAGAADSWDW